ncbi:1-hydroxy-2-methyl-2-(E)-butenyl 4-diphosphate synthase [Cutibacterium acnes JCM 18916]|nr:1-hydroxy-2-methyl-2-(E)-butenyl 4-diphosphate synthase [Cutibacterium acnes JCM 18916]
METTTRDFRSDTSMTVNLGMPTPPVPTLAPRRKTHQIKVGDVLVGGDAPISVQSMTTTKTHDVGATLQQIAALTAAGCDIVRVACPTDKDAEVLPIIAKRSQIPVIADIHFQPKYVFQAIEAGCGAVRVNPGNIRKFDDQIESICQAATEHGTSIRIGVNAGSLDKRLLDKYGAPTAEAMVESALWEASLFEQYGFRDFKISVKHHDPVVMIRAYEQLAAKCDYPLHLGVTELVRPSKAPSSRRWPSGTSLPRVSVTPYASPCRLIRSRKSRWVSRSWSRSTYVLEV